MKKYLLLLAGVLLLLSSACGSKTESLAVWSEGHGQDILDSGAFSEELEELDADTAWALYGLGQAGLDRESLTSAMCRRSAGATCEELAVLVFNNEEAASAAVSSLQSYVEDQIEANRDYRPAEIPKLENAWISQRGYTLLMVVADDLQAAKQAVGES